MSIFERIHTKVKFRSFGKVNIKEKKEDKVDKVGTDKDDKN